MSLPVPFGDDLQPSEIDKQNTVSAFLLRLKDFFPVTSVVLILFGLGYQMLYYYSFDIDIKNYIGIGELILAFADNLAIMLLAIIFIANIAATYFVDAKSRIEFGLNSKKKNILKLFTGEFISLFFIIAVYSIYGVKQNDFVFFVIIIIYMSYPIIFFLISWFFLRRTGKIITPAIIHIVLLAIFTLACFYYLTINDVQKTKQGKFIGTVIYTRNGNDTSTSIKYFIGKTQDFVFIKDLKDSTTIVIPHSEILKIKIKVNRPKEKN